VLTESLERLLREVADDAVVLDVGGWASPLARADWVLDLMPYETRGLYGTHGPGPERFSAGTWVRRDLCERTPYPFADDSIDFVVCSHTLEDVRDPIWVCSEMSRIARAGYVEVPSRLEEQSIGVQGPWVGWSHHRWLIDVPEGRIEFRIKPHFLHTREEAHFSRAFRAGLSPARRVQTLWWTDTLEAVERVMLGPDEIDRYVAEIVSRHEPGRGGRPHRPWVQRVGARGRAAIRRARGLSRRGRR
jgi:hypothetical protein